NWGTGKSSLLNLIEEKLPTADFLVIKFNAWFYHELVDAKFALMELIQESLEKESQQNQSALDKIKHFGEKLDLLKFTKVGINVASAVGLAAATSDPSKLADLNLFSLADVFKSNTLSTKSIEEIRKTFAEIVQGLNKNVVVVIDNLDRCNPREAVEVLEAIRLFLFISGVSFIIAVDKEMIMNSVAQRFAGLTERHRIDYLDKLIQIPLQLPKLGVGEIRSYMFLLYAEELLSDTAKLNTLAKFLREQLMESWKKQMPSIEEILDYIGEKENNLLRKSFLMCEAAAAIFADSMPDLANPRTIKRLLNTVRVRKIISEKISAGFDDELLLKLAMLEKVLEPVHVEAFYKRMEDFEKFRKEIETIEKSDNDTFSDLIEKFFGSRPTPYRLNFLQSWINLEPRLSEIQNLKASLYLYRDTVPITARSKKLSDASYEAIEGLKKIGSLLSEAGSELIKNIPDAETVAVMNELIREIQKNPEINGKTPGAKGAQLLAMNREETKQIFSEFLERTRKENPGYLWIKGALENLKEGGK
ncbi:KAP family P-loop NTPase fold protein, partial [Turicimonas muris]